MTMRFLATAECNSCGNEPDHVIDMPEDYSDSDLREAIEDQAHDCYECGDQDWASLGRVQPQPGAA